MMAPLKPPTSPISVKNVYAVRWYSYLVSDRSTLMLACGRESLDALDSFLIESIETNSKGSGSSDRKPIRSV